jgi:hypothetical protein
MAVRLSALCAGNYATACPQRNKNSLQINTEIDENTKKGNNTHIENSGTKLFSV